MNQEKEINGLSLLKKGQKGLFASIFSRLGLFLILLLIQVFFLFSIFQWFESFLLHIYSIAILFSVAIVLYLLNSSINSTAKITWLIIILLFPLFGGLLYLYTLKDIGHRALKKRVQHLISQTKNCISQSESTFQSFQELSKGSAALCHYLNRSGCYPVYTNTSVTYFPNGEAKFEELLRQLEQAKEFIFLEYFIISEGLMWGRILEILARKAAQGVDVRVMYDGTCEFVLLPPSYPKKLKKLGIKCRMFSPVSPFISTHYNYRDHRKILVIDGHTAFNGGINLADEYINHVQRFGHWKDTAVMLKGEAVQSFTLMFLQTWSILDKNPEFDYFLHNSNPTSNSCKGFVIPFGDYPLDHDKVGEQVYMDLLNRSQKYVHIMTPYLILDDEMENALKFAAERGVDVKLILPGIPDKFIPYSLAFTHYASLLESGVQIFEYTPGFVHAKSFVCDDFEAVVGTINLDYRSLYHHFECATYLCNVDCISSIEDDFKTTLEKCRQITKQTIKTEKFSRKFTGIIMKAIAPLL